MKKFLLLAGSLLNLLALNSAQALEGNPVPDEPDVRLGSEFYGSVFTCYIQKGSGLLKHSGGFSVFLNPSKNELQPVAGSMSIRSAGSGPDTCFMPYLNENDPHCGNLIFTNLAPLGGTFSHVYFDSTKVPGVVIGRQRGLFFRTDPRIDLNFDGDSEFLYQKTDGSLGVWFMTNSIRGPIQLSNLIAGVYLDYLYQATGNAKDTNWHIITQRDSNQDGILDWYWQNTATGNLRLWQFHTDLIAQADLTSPEVVTDVDISDSQPTEGDKSKLVGVSDFDNDRAPDYLFMAEDRHLFFVKSGDSFGNQFSVRTNRNGTDFQAPAGWSVASIADMNHDGWPDIIWQHTNGSISVWIIKANGAYARTISINNATTSPALRLVGNNDFDHNGSMDLLFRHKNGGFVIWYMRGTTRIHTGSLLGPDLSWEVVGPK